MGHWKVEIACSKINQVFISGQFLVTSENHLFSSYQLTDISAKLNYKDEGIAFSNVHLEKIFQQTLAAVSANKISLSANSLSYLYQKHKE